MRVKEIMSAPLVAVGRETPLKEVGRLLVERRITGVPVVDDGSAVGVVSQSDLVRLEQETDAECLATPRPLRHLRRRAVRRRHRTAGDVMSSPARTIELSAPAVGAAWVMTEHDVDRLVVTDHGSPVGIVTRADLVRAFGRSDEDVRREIVESVLPSLCLSTDVEVSVAGGEVVLRGTVEDELAACCVEQAVRRVLGVVEVAAELAPLHPYRHAAPARSRERVDPVSETWMRRRT